MSIRQDGHAEVETNSNMRLPLKPALLLTGWMLLRAMAHAGEPVTNLSVGPVTNATVLQWLWTTQCLVNVEAEGQGSVVPGSDWYDMGTNVLISALPSNYHHFVSWTGDTNGCVLSNAVIERCLNR